ncbi:hypothetical protein D9757_008196 [Collybiopsis confluens]|uniref:Uncharacterized protein n=1 Tax=Collybiopsis confluens TaxID=2823264 RepID=A0A8H5M3V5_9AGAR|nr:hypothetical protein D9757_008196 [Collybiopsis confluens]
MAFPDFAKPKALFVNAPHRVPDEDLIKLNELVDAYVIQQDRHDVLAERIRRAVAENGPFIAYVQFTDWWNLPEPWPLDEKLLSPLVDTGCKMFTCPGAGYDWADVEYLTSKGCYFANTPKSPALRTADSTAMMILQALRGSSEREADARAGRWYDSTKPLAKDARSSVLGILGLGTIGKLVSEHMQHFGMKVIYHNRTRLPPEEENGAEYVSFDQLLALSDVISLHCPLNESTRHLFNEQVFENMKDGMIIVNTARGAVIDEDALVKALDSGKVLRAALDVFEFEPRIHSGLVSSPHTTLYPHCAVANETFLRDQRLEVLLNLKTFIETGKPVNAVNVLI